MDRSRLRSPLLSSPPVLVKMPPYYGESSDEDVKPPARPKLITKSASRTPVVFQARTRTPPLMRLGSPAPTRSKPAVKKEVVDPTYKPSCEPPHSPAPPRRSARSRSAPRSGAAEIPSQFLEYRRPVRARSRPFYGEDTDDEGEKKPALELKSLAIRPLTPPAKARTPLARGRTPPARPAAQQNAPRSPGPRARSPGPKVGAKRRIAETSSEDEDERKKHDDDDRCAELKIEAMQMKEDMKKAMEYLQKLNRRLNSVIALL